MFEDPIKHIIAGKWRISISRRRPLRLSQSCSKDSDSKIARERTGPLVAMQRRPAHYIPPLVLRWLERTSSLAAP